MQTVSFVSGDDLGSNVVVCGSGRVGGAIIVDSESSMVILFEEIPLPFLN